jgi:hypothetical protein
VFGKNSLEETRNYYEKKWKYLNPKIVGFGR